MFTLICWSPSYAISNIKIITKKLYLIAIKYKKENKIIKYKSKLKYDFNTNIYYGGLK